MSIFNIDELKKKWTIEQNKLVQSIITEDQFDEIKLIGGLDISFVKDSDNACVTLSIMSYPDLKLVHHMSKMVLLKYPYVSGFLAFREVEHFINLLNDFEKEKPELKPQMILIDGNGIFHHRKCGSACHIGVLSGYPTIGVSKNLLYVEQFSREWINQQISQQIKNIPLEKGSSFKMIGTTGYEYGACLLNGSGTKNPLYVSIGHKVNLDTALKIVLTCSKTKIPEPIRQADLISRQYIRDNKDKIIISTKNQTFI